MSSKNSSSSPNTGGTTHNPGALDPETISNTLLGVDHPVSVYGTNTDTGKSGTGTGSTSGEAKSDWDKKTS